MIAATLRKYIDGSHIWSAEIIRRISLELNSRQSLGFLRNECGGAWVDAWSASGSWGSVGGAGAIINESRTRPPNSANDKLGPQGSCKGRRQPYLFDRDRADSGTLVLPLLAALFVVDNVTKQGYRMSTRRGTSPSTRTYQLVALGVAV